MPPIMNKNIPKNSIIVAISFIAFVLAPVLSFEETGDVGVVYLMALTLPAIFQWAKFGKRQMQNYQICYVLFLISAILSTLVGSYGVFDQRVIKLLLFVLYGLSVTSFSYTPENFTLFIKCHATVACIVAVLICLSFIYGYAHVESEYFLGRYSIGITGLYKNPNYLTSFINLSLFLLLYYILYSSSRSIRWYIAVIICILIICADYFSGTRAALMTGISTMLTMFVLYVFKSEKKIIGVLPILIAFTGFVVYQDAVFELLDSFLGGRAANEDTGRQISWALAISKIYESPIFGCGLFSWSNLGGNFLLDYLHNIYLEIILDQGLLGFFIFLAMLFSGIRYIKKEDKLFVFTFIIVSGFPMVFQNGVVAINLWKFILLNRIVIDYSRYSNHSIHSLFHGQ